MGYKVATRAVVDFSGTAWEGAEVKVGINIPLQDLIKLSGAVEGKDLGKLDTETFGLILGLFEPRLSEWNLVDEETDEPIPCNAETFAEQPAGFQLTVLTGWVQAALGGTVKGPLRESSPSGEQPAAALELPELTAVS